MYQPIYPMIGTLMSPMCYYCMASRSPISYETMMQPETLRESVYDKQYEDVDEDGVKEYKLSREENLTKETKSEHVDAAEILSPENKGYRWMRGEDDSNTDRGVSQPEPPSQGMGGMPEMTDMQGMQGHQGSLPGGMQQQSKMSPAEILGMIETHHPEIMKTMATYGIPQNTARQLITRIIEMTLMHSM